MILQNCFIMGRLREVQMSANRVKTQTARSEYGSASNIMMK